MLAVLVAGQEPGSGAPVVWGAAWLVRGVRVAPRQSWCSVSLSPLLPPLHARSARLPVRQFAKPVFSNSMCDVRCGAVVEIMISNFHIIEGEGIRDIPRLGHEACGAGQQHAMLLRSWPLRAQLSLIIGVWATNEQLHVEDVSPVKSYDEQNECRPHIKLAFAVLLSTRSTSFKLICDRPLSIQVGKRIPGRRSRCSLALVCS